jgi:chemotaxis protein CheY-P-specific phosphatase CheC
MSSRQRRKRKNNRNEPKVSFPGAVTPVLFILVLLMTGSLTPAIVDHECTGFLAPRPDFTRRGEVCPTYNVSAAEWMDESYEMRYLSLFEIDILSEYGIHKISILNQTGLSADGLRLLYEKNSSAVLEALNKSAGALANATSNRTFSELKWNATTPEISVDETTLMVPPGGDPYNPPVKITGYMRVKVSPDTFDLLKSSEYSPGDIMTGMLSMGAEIRLPMELRCDAGHNQTVTSFPPKGVIFGDGKSYYPGIPLIWKIVNFEGTVDIFAVKTLAIIASDRVSYHSAKVTIDSLFEFTNVSFLTNGDTEFKINVTVAARIYRIAVNQSIQKWYSRYLSFGYINADFLRFLLRIGIVSDSELYGYIGVINDTIQAGIRSAFSGVSGLESCMTITGLHDGINITAMKDSPPVSIYVNASFSYRYKPGGAKAAGDMGPGGQYAGNTVTGVRLLTIERTFQATLPGPMRAGHNFMGDGMMNYTFRTPPNVIVFNVTADGARITAIKKDETYSFTVTFRSDDKDKNLIVVFGAEVEYEIEPLIPYIILLLTLLAVWLTLFIAGKKRDKALKNEQKEKLERGELFEDEKEEVP